MKLKFTYGPDSDRREKGVNDIDIDIIGWDYPIPRTGETVQMADWFPIEFQETWWEMKVRGVVYWKEYIQILLRDRNSTDLY